jgi:beta-alanine--pyruvate transaminase
LPENKFSKGCPKTGASLAEELVTLIKEHDAETIAAVIVEPMSGSAGVLPPPEGYLDRLREICTEHNILLIFDEVITAFGRIGAKTAAEKFSVTPDIICSAKQLTNGAIPMGAVICDEMIHQTFMEQDLPEYLLEFPHGYTYSAHPVACAAALATLNYIEQNAVIHQVTQISPYFEDALHSLKSLDLVEDIRNLGLAGALTIQAKEEEPALRPYLIAMHCWQQGFYVRYAADTIQLGLPFSTTKAEIDSLINVIAEGIKALA